MAPVGVQVPLAMAHDQAATPIAAWEGVRGPNGQSVVRAPDGTGWPYLVSLLGPALSKVGRELAKDLPTDMPMKFCESRFG